MTAEQVEEVLETRVRSVLRAHGGEVRLVSCEDSVVRVALWGACAGCPSADLSTRGFIQETLVGALPEPVRVELVRGVDPELLDFARRLLRHEDGM